MDPPPHFSIAERQLCSIIIGNTPSSAVDEKITDAAVRQGMDALLYEIPGIEGDIRTALRSRIANPQGMGLARELALGDLLTALNKTDVQVLLMKGFPLGYQVYASPGLRPCVDVDLLVRRDQLEQVQGVLDEAGYTVKFGDTAPDVSQQFMASKSFESGYVLDFDIHYSINNQAEYANRFTFEELMDRSAPLPRICEHARSLGLDDAFLLACIHRAGHLANGEPEKLIWLYDIHLMLEKLSAGLDCELVSLIEDKSLQAVCRSGVDASVVAFQSAVPPGLAHVIDQVPSRDVELAVDDPVTKLWRSFRGQSSNQARMAFLRQLFFPPADYMRRKYPDSSSGLPVLYARRAWSGFTGRMKIRRRIRDSRG